MIEQHQLRLLELGAAGRLLIAGEIEEVLPLDDDDLLDRANPPPRRERSGLTRKR
jgi:hypothetical protein